MGYRRHYISERAENEAQARHPGEGGTVMDNQLEQALKPSKQARKRQRMDALNRETISLEAAGLVEAGRAPLHGYQSVHRYVEWFSDGDDSRYCMN